MKGLSFLSLSLIISYHVVCESKWSMNDREVLGWGTREGGFVIHRSKKSIAREEWLGAGLLGEDVMRSNLGPME